MKTRVIILVAFFCSVAEQAHAQFNLSLTSGINNTAYGIGTNLLTRFPNQVSIPVGLDVQYAFGQHAKPVFVAFRAGVSYLSSGYSYLKSDPTLSFSNSSEMVKKYLRVPITLRLYFQPMPLVDRFTLFVGGGVSLHKPLSIELTEVYSSSNSTVKDSKDLSSLAPSSYLFSVLEAGLSYRRIQVSFRFGRSTGNMFIAGFDKNWKVPAANSYYLSQHKEPGDAYEKHRELVLAFKLF